ncbi:MAG: hypothetical protein MPEBLZ_01137 [Candidatus Methanoperedens nitroreducens]|uniref:Uncharacterized protein n=1 Tax=Candidatus Methanoperedens nitratireducens TaxID=1392998 RepID=A0A0P7ZK26_9EURY|nr:hypothetical protein [Candidatus Methanoperedens sp. BLZ2]KAB2946966.1 MAG: hypothetical protein F9K14_05890 [Candidatus Methanoperedens sp.]KPQ44276.1 MAG: hypothetical protein MPEBLZ_01137 [Candidatus Methanoperedens sp. BLZ1]MBZ0176767.1 hypothetical protein [Candidatus Methanoperedens nitroreducens]MCX9080488.1 hypothetical protein [Candidatus Methanoperedens sp.]MCX9088291.1 hypothetical protein [Candidatus Methanoperedens sp.]
MITKQELIEELKVKEPRKIRKELQEKLLKKWKSDGEPVECGCGKEIPGQSEHYKQIQNNMFIVACGKRRKLKMPERYDAAAVLRQLVPWIIWDEKPKIAVEML